MITTRETHRPAEHPPAASPLGGTERGTAGSSSATPVSGWWRGFDRRELRRRIWHMSPGLLPFLLWLHPHRDPLSPTLRWIMIGVIAAIAARIALRYASIARADEGDSFGCVFGYAASVLAMLLLFPGQIELGLTVLAVLAFGDGSATIGGLLLGGPTLPWNRNKTWSGFVSFLIVGTLMGTIIYWGETAFNPESLGPGVPIGVACLIASLTNGVAAVAESLPSKIDDNVRVGLAASAAVVCAHGWLVGWAY